MISQNNIDYGNVVLGGDLGDVWLALGAPLAKGFGGAVYDHVSSTDAISRDDAGYSDGYWHITNPSPLSFSQDKFEMFAFGASSIVAAVGGVNSMAGLSGVFDVNGSINLNQAFGANSRFNNLNTGHSAQFVHSYLDVMGYWQNLVGDIT